MPSSRWAALALALAGSLGSAALALDPPPSVDRIVIEKGAHRLTLLYRGKPVKAYAVALGRGPAGRKERKGDGRTPEGLYVIDARNPRSAFHASLHISYPNAQDKSAAAALGADPGGDIMIHGIRNGLGWLGRLHRALDWTNGCVAVTDREMDEIYRSVPLGTPVEIRS